MLLCTFPADALMHPCRRVCATHCFQSMRLRYFNTSPSVAATASQPATYADSFSTDPASNVTAISPRLDVRRLNATVVKIGLLIPPLVHGVVNLLD